MDYSIPDWLGIDRKDWVPPNPEAGGGGEEGSLGSSSGRGSLNSEGFANNGANRGSGIGAGLPTALPGDIASLEALQTSSANALASTASKLESLNESLLRGELPEDVSAQIKMLTAEKSLSGGLGASSQASKNLTARDLGRTSLDIKQMGFENSKIYSAMREASANIAARRTEFEKNYLLNVEKFREGTREFNESQDMTVTGYILNAASARADAQIKMASLGLGSDGITEDFTNLIDQLQGLLNGD